jgi:hypothetical protein
LDHGDDPSNAGGLGGLPAATIIGNQIPAMFASAVEEQSLLTVRLQSADELFTPPTSITKVRSKIFDDEVFWGNNQPSPFNN